MRTIGNFLWFFFGGGWLAGLGWFLSGLLMYLTVVGIPWGKSCFVIGAFSIFPFGREAIDRKDLKGQTDMGTGALGLLGNVLWFLFAGWWLALGLVGLAIVYFISIIGIPFGIQHLKLAGVSLAPMGKTIVSKEVASEARRRAASDFVDARRGPSVDVAPASVSDVEANFNPPGPPPAEAHQIPAPPPALPALPTQLPKSAVDRGVNIQPRPRLSGQGAAVQGRVIDLDSGVTVGRSQGCDLVLPDDRISRQHAWIGPAGDAVVVRDLGSTNGTLVNGQGVETQPLQHGDIIQFGRGHEWSFVYQEAG
jgi:uncharacterized membrane protein YccF (DUF307 family)